MARGTIMHQLPSAESPGAHARRAVILFVEGDVMLRQSMAQSLRKAGFEVVEAARMAEALKVLRSIAPIDILLTEMQGADDLDGVSLSHMAKESRPGLKIVVASTQAPEWPFRRLIDDFVGKPYDSARVIQRISDLLANPAE
jgi:DNA-binding response OmpR family regulator